MPNPHNTARNSRLDCSASADTLIICHKYCAQLFFFQLPATKGYK